MNNDFLVFDHVTKRFGALTAVDDVSLTVGKGEFFLLRANGRSMIKAGIDDGDLVVIRQQDDAEPGQIVVALVDDDTATLKRYYPRRNSRVELVPENDEFRTQTIDLSVQHLSIQGVAVKVIKSLA